MSAWRKQAVPLIFVDVCMEAVLKSNGHLPVVQRIGARVDRWVHECWEPLRAKAGRIDDKQAQKVVERSTAAIHKHLAKFWGRDGVKTVSELPSALLVVVEDTYATMCPVKHKGRRRAWAYLIKALFDLCLAADPDLTDNAGQERGIKIAGMVMREAR